MSLVVAKNAILALAGRSTRSTTVSRDGQGDPSPLSPTLDPLLHSSEGDGLRHHHSKYSRAAEAGCEDLESQASTLSACDPHDRGCGGYGSLDDDNRSPSPSPSPSSSSSSSISPSRISARVISDATIGLSDGLTVPFALTAGLSALSDTRIVIFGGLAELIAGAISMGLGGYLGAKSEAASYKETLDRTHRLICADPHGAALAVRSVFEPYDLPKDTLDDLSDRITASPDLAGFLMRFQHLEVEPSSSRAFMSGLTIALGYFLGGLLPLLPYLCVDDLYTGLAVSVGVMAVALFSFGYSKTCMVAGWGGSRCVRKGLVGGAQMVVVGGAAAAAAMLLVRLFDSFR